VGFWRPLAILIRVFKGDLILFPIFLFLIYFYFSISAEEHLQSMQHLSSLYAECISRLCWACMHVCSSHPCNFSIRQSLNTYLISRGETFRFLGKCPLLLLAHTSNVSVRCYEASQIYTKILIFSISYFCNDKHSFCNCKNKILTPIYITCR
jgi:hypothetical protein